jgi:hypothetical protein
VNVRIFYQDILFLLEILDSLSSDYDYLHLLNHGAVQFFLEIYHFSWKVAVISSGTSADSFWTYDVTS